MKKPIIPDDSPFLAHETRRNRWAVPYHPDCLNARINHLLAENLPHIEGKNILDVGSHMGTFAYAALMLGANFIQGIDTEEKMILLSRELFQKMSIAKDKYSMTVADACQFLENIEEGTFETVFCLGMLYYTSEPYRLLKLMLRAAKESLIIDTFTAGYAAVQGKDAPQVSKNINEETLQLPIMFAALTQPGKKDYTLPHSFDYRSKELSLITLPSSSLLEIWFNSLNVEFKKLDWSFYSSRSCTYKDLLTPDQKISSHWADVYKSGIRVSYVLSK